MDTNMIENAVKSILKAIGEDPERDGLKETPQRVSGMIQECLRNVAVTNDEIARKYCKCFYEPNQNGQLVIVKDIPSYSWCEHHLALMFDMRVTVAYRPKNFVIGLSKIPRIVDAVCRRLQIQERIGNDIMEIVKKITKADDVAVIIYAKHSCVAARGIKSDCETKTISICGNINMDEIL
jgi:GTP cyclohydrolase I